MRAEVTGTPTALPNIEEDVAYTLQNVGSIGIVYFAVAGAPPVNSDEAHVLTELRTPLSQATVKVEEDSGENVYVWGDGGPVIYSKAVD